MSFLRNEIRKDDQAAENNVNTRSLNMPRMITISVRK